MRVITFLLLLLATPVIADNYAALRSNLINEVNAVVRLTSPYLGKDTLDKRVVEALAKVPRHEFVSEDQGHAAYQNRPLPIGFGQTISQPYMVAIMTDLLALKPGDKVFELGTGSGYQAAILAELVNTVYTVEIIPDLGRLARQTLTRLLNFQKLMLM